MSMGSLGPGDSFLGSYGGLAAIGVSCVSIVCKETLFHFTLKVGKEMGSSTVVANAWQHRQEQRRRPLSFGTLVDNLNNIYTDLTRLSLELCLLV